MTTTAGYYHLSKQAIGRGQGRSAIAAAAYRTGTSITNEREGTVCDYTRKRGVVASWTIAPEGAPEWASDTAALWNAVEAKENRKNSQLAHELTLALPASLDDAGRADIMERFGKELRDRYCCAVTIGIHRPSEQGDDRNDHAHVMLTTRKITPAGWGDKIRELNSLPQVSEELAHIRERAAELINDALEEAGSDERVDHRSFKSRGVENRTPTTHLGPTVTGMERGGFATERGDINRDIIAERIAEQEKLMAAIAARHFDQTAPVELTLATERELESRFGREWRETSPGREAMPPPVSADGWQETPPAGDVSEALQPEIDRVQATGTTHWHSGILGRIRAAKEAFYDLLRDESGVAPEGENGLKGWATKVLAERAVEAAGNVARWLRGDPGDPDNGNEPHAPPGEPARPDAGVEAPEPQHEPQAAVEAPIESGRFADLLAQYMRDFENPDVAGGDEESEWLPVGEEPETMPEQDILPEPQPEPEPDHGLDMEPDF